CAILLPSHRRSTNVNSDDALQSGARPSFETTAADAAGAPMAVEPSKIAAASRRLWWIVALAAVVAAIAPWLVAESGVTKVRPANSPVPTSGVVIMVPTVTTTQAADVKIAARVFGLFGGLLGLLLGFAGGWSQRCLRSACAGLLFGLL